MVLDDILGAQGSPVHLDHLLQDGCVRGDNDDPSQTVPRRMPQCEGEPAQGLAAASRDGEGKHAGSEFRRTETGVQNFSPHPVQGCVGCLADPLTAGFLDLVRQLSNAYTGCLPRLSAVPSFGIKQIRIDQGREDKACSHGQRLRVVCG